MLESLSRARARIGMACAGGAAFRSNPHPPACARGIRGKGGGGPGPLNGRPMENSEKKGAETNGKRRCAGWVPAHVRVLCVAALPFLAPTPAPRLGEMPMGRPPLQKKIGGPFVSAWRVLPVARQIAVGARCSTLFPPLPRFKFLLRRNRFFLQTPLGPICSHRGLIGWLVPILGWFEGWHLGPDFFPFGRRATSARRTRRAKKLAQGPAPKEQPPALGGLRNII